MIHIKYQLKTSELHGIGLFADQAVRKGDIVYTASPLLDLNITQEQFDSLDQKEKGEILWWGFFDEPSQMWHVDFDVSKFINHSYIPSLTQDSNHDDACLLATRDIEAGEELTQNYLEFEGADDLQRRGIPLKADLS
ncbi:MAG TPA: SET domain-containing protein [Candidatus Saccharimonadales bacterium]|nr:SET domain-containing protein [Candidatus Saccharimonadales bacterium]